MAWPEGAHTKGHFDVRDCPAIPSISHAVRAATWLLPSREHRHGEGQLAACASLFLAVEARGADPCGRCSRGLPLAVDVFEHLADSRDRDASTVHVARAMCSECDPLTEIRGVAVFL